ncbi:uncharacterized protein LOC100116951 [Nasonia vitripennis]|uniref:Golgi membrane protein 1 n=1 Tax=Nasonia vitripennis TaxID=7425 RepID=A0A7M7Q4P0_NASVI|nr:uncharacterized protein LOC100116951 [Nasonia vitripennis]XP_031780247.1 uncharacterized protein LOC100116951 [Nasonia vitripennis]
MSIDSMRVGGGRCPPLLVGGLLIACIMMVCNWWTLSSTNLELLRQIDELNEQIKISVEERDQCVTHSGSVEKQLQSCTDDARTTHVKLSQVEDMLSTCNEEVKSYKTIDITKSSTLEALRVDKETIKKKLDVKQEENKKLDDELKQVKDELQKLKLTMNAPPQKQSPSIPIARFLEKPQSDNKTVVNVAPNPRINMGETQGQDAQDKDNSNREDNAAEVGDAGINAIDSELNFQLMSDAKARETIKK